MSPEENLAWFEEAKGKKIRHTTWLKHCYCVVKDTELAQVMSGVVRCDGSFEAISIGNGWEEDASGYGWKLCHDEITPNGAAITTLVNDAYCGCANRSPVAQKYNTFSFTLCNNCKKEIK
jgi:hypothetical protein